MCPPQIVENYKTILCSTTAEKQIIKNVQTMQTKHAIIKSTKRYVIQNIYDEVYSPHRQYKQL